MKKPAPSLFCFTLLFTQLPAHLAPPLRSTTHRPPSFFLVAVSVVSNTQSNAGQANKKPQHQCENWHEIKEKTKGVENILRCLATHGSVRHAELSKGTGIPHHTLTEQMKPILCSGAARSSSHGTNTTYDITDAGKGYLLYRSFTNCGG